MVECGLLLAVALYAVLVGLRALRIWRVEFATRAGTIAAAGALGLGLISYIVLSVGLAGHLHLWAILAAAVGIAGLLLAQPVPNLPARYGLGSSNRHLPYECIDHPRHGTPGIDWRQQGVRRMILPGVLCIAVTGTLICALAPPTAGDALCYHLEIPKRFVQIGAVSYLPLTDNSLFPMLMEMLYTLGILLSGPVLAQLMHWFVGLLFAFAVVEMAQPIVGSRGSWWAGLVATLVPGVTNQMSGPLNDLATALYCTLMIVAWMRWLDTSSARWLVLSAVFGGLGLSVKLVSAGMVALVFASVVLHEVRVRGWQSAVRRALLCTAILTVCGGIWYGRSWWYEGNPIYPYFNQFFGLESHTKSTLVATRHVVLAPWLVTMFPESFGGRGVQFGAIFLALVPGLALLPARPPGLTRLLPLILGYAALWFSVRQDLRFLLPIVPMLAVCAVAVVQALRDVHRPAYLVARTCLICLLVFQGLIQARRVRPCLAVVTGVESRETYLLRREPSYAVARFVNSRLGPECRLISQDYRGLYFEPQFVREESLCRRVPYRARDESLIQFLAACGFTHVLLVDAHNPEFAVYDPGFVERLGHTPARLPLVFSNHYESANGDSRDYRLYALPAPRDPKGSFSSDDASAIAMIHGEVARFTGSGGTEDLVLDVGRRGGDRFTLRGN